MTICLAIKLRAQVSSLLFRKWYFLPYSFVLWYNWVFCTLQDAASSLSIFTGEEEVFAFQRTVSRLTEMQTEEYWVEGDRSSS